MKLDTISTLGTLCMISKINGVNHRTTIPPSSSHSKEVREILESDDQLQQAVDALHTPEVVEAYRLHLESAV